MRIVLFAACVSLALFNSAYAEEPASSGLSDDKIREIAEKNIPDEISVKLTEESEDAVAMKTCQKTLQGLKVPKNCCADPKCVRNAIRQRDNEAFEKRRAEVNRKFCLEYGGGLDLCNSDPATVRQFVIDYRAQKKVEEAEKSEQARRDAERAKSSAEEAIRLANEAKKTASEVKHQPPVIVRVSDDNGPNHHLDLGITAVGHLEGAYGGGVYASYRPPFVGERLALSVTVGSVVVVRNRLQLDNFDPVARAYGDANLSFRVLNWEKLSLALGASYSRVGKFGMDKLTAEMWGPTATLNIGVLQLHAAYLYNTGPINGYLTPEWGVLLRAGFRFADFKF